VEEELTADPARDFDFETGAWRVSHHRLKERLTGCTEWETFEGTTDQRLILGGNGNIEDNVMHMPAGIVKAVALRSFEDASGTWAIWWLSSAAPHSLDVPVKGRFENGDGAFYADDVLRGMPIRVRFLWLDTKTERPRWEQAFSADGGKTWETNWRMAFERV
jgi:hypothetical protein